MRHLFIVNPVAGGKRNHFEDVIRHIHEVMAGRTGAYDIYTTVGPMDARDAVLKASETGEPLRVYACGGDGTLNECINGAAGRSHVAVAHYPCGTGNDFIKMFGKDEKRFHELPALLDGFTHPVDLIEVKTDHGAGRYGLNICSIGIDARIGTDVHKYSAIPVIGGATGYVVSMAVNLFRGINQRLKITAGSTTLNGSFALVCACNGRFYGGGFNPVPDAMPDDGLIDFLIVTGVSRLKFLRVVGKYAKGRYKDIDDIITHIRGKHMLIEGDTELAINVDGELLRSKEVTFQLIPEGVTFIIPSGISYFESESVQFAVK